MTNIKSQAELQAYMDANTTFGGYERFADDRKRRETQIAEFITDVVYAPEFSYPRLEGLRDFDVSEVDEPIIDAKKRTAYEAMWELDAHRDQGVFPESLVDLYSAMHEKKLTVVLMVEAADAMRTAGTSQSRLVAREQFTLLNEALYGPMDTAAFSSIMLQEQQRVNSFDAKGVIATNVQDDLRAYFERHAFSGAGAELLTRDELSRTRTAVLHKYSSVLDAFPDSSDDHMYGTDETVAIMQSVLDSDSLGQKGWKVEVDPTATVPNTNVSRQRIFLNPGKQRSANQIKRLYLHEVEVHARRAQNGIDSGYSLLGRGTVDSGDVEEGLGLTFEILHAGSFESPGFMRARDRYMVAGLALGTDGLPRDARQTFELMWRFIALRNADEGRITERGVATAQQQAMTHIENAFRGTDGVQRGVIYAKLKTYYEGFVKNADFLKRNIDNLDEALSLALAGKFDHTDRGETNLVTQLLASRD